MFFTHQLHMAESRQEFLHLQHIHPTLKLKDPHDRIEQEFIITQQKLGNSRFTEYLLPYVCMYVCTTNRLITGLYNMGVGIYSSFFIYILIYIYGICNPVYYYRSLINRRASLLPKIIFNLLIFISFTPIISVSYIMLAARVLIALILYSTLHTLTTGFLHACTTTNHILGTEY